MRACRAVPIVALLRLTPIMAGRIARLPVDAEAHCYNRYVDAIVSSVSNPKIRAWMEEQRLDFAARRQAAWLTAGPPSPRAHPLVLGGGFGSTGTTSLALALDRLGLVTWHAHMGATVRANASAGAGAITPDDFRRSIGRAWSSARCSAELTSINYRVPPSVGALVDRPSAESFLDLWWANPNALVLLTHRPAADWVRSRSSFGLKMNLPLDRPCHNLSFADASAKEAGRMLTLHDDLVQCVVPKRQLIDIDVFSRSTSGLMGMLSRAITGHDPPPGMPLEFPAANVHSRIRASRLRSAAAANQAMPPQPPPPPPVPSAAAGSTPHPQNRLSDEEHTVTRRRGTSPASGIPRGFITGPSRLVSSRDTAGARRAHLEHQSMLQKLHMKRPPPDATPRPTPPPDSAAATASSSEKTRPSSKLMGRAKPQPSGRWAAPNPLPHELRSRSTSHRTAAAASASRKRREELRQATIAKASRSSAKASKPAAKVQPSAVGAGGANTAGAECSRMQNQHLVIVGSSWGTLPTILQQRWNRLSCDLLVPARPDAPRSGVAGAFRTPGTSG